MSLVCRGKKSLHALFGGGGERRIRAFEVGLMGVDYVVENSDLVNVLNARFTRK